MDWINFFNSQSKDQCFSIENRFVCYLYILHTTLNGKFSVLHRRHGVYEFPGPPFACSSWNHADFPLATHERGCKHCLFLIFPVTIIFDFISSNTDWNNAAYTAITTSFVAIFFQKTPEMIVVSMFRSSVKSNDQKTNTLGFCCGALRSHRPFRTVSRRSVLHSPDDSWTRLLPLYSITLLHDNSMDVNKMSSQIKKPVRCVFLSPREASPKSHERHHRKGIRTFPIRLNLGPTESVYHIFLNKSCGVYSLTFQNLPGVKSRPGVEAHSHYSRLSDDLIFARHLFSAGFFSRQWTGNLEAKLPGPF